MLNIFDKSELNINFDYDQTLLNSKNNHVKEVKIVSNYEEFFFDNETLKKLKKFEKQLNNCGIDLVFSGSVNKIKFSLDEVVTANKKLDFLERVINESTTMECGKKRKLTTLEKYILIYNFCTQFKYNESDENRLVARTVVSVLNTDKIVCVGYAELLMELCKRCGILCVEQSVFLAKSQDEIEDMNEEFDCSNHSNNLVYIKDKTYGFDQVIYCDSCNDAPNEKGARNSTKYLFVPLTHAGNFENGKIYKNGQILSEHIQECRQNFEQMKKGKDFKLSKSINKLAGNLTLSYINTVEEVKITEKVLTCQNEKVLEMDTLIDISTKIKNATFNNLPVLSLVRKNFIDNADLIVLTNKINNVKLGMNALMERALGR